MSVASRTRSIALAAATIASCSAGAAFAHDVTEGDRGYIATTQGVRIGAFFYLGAKHMVTGYDHLLFLMGVIFFLYRLRQVAAYVTLFAIGHSTTLILGVLFRTSVNAYLIDAVIALSVAYKALDNVGAFQRWFGVRPDPRAAVLVFGFFHGLGLATKLQDLGLSSDGLLANLVAFNLGVETGQLLALAAILIVMGYWRRSAGFARHATAANVVLMTAGLVLFGQQIAGYFLGSFRMAATGQEIVTLPTLRRLNTAVLIAAAAAAAITVAAVLPAEYGVDPTGIGRLLGLTGMGEMRMAQANAKTPAGPVAGDAITTMPDGSRRVQIVLDPYGGREVKAAMHAGAEMTYRWSTDGAPVEFEFHGEPDIPKTPGEYSSYQKGTTASAAGTFKAEFAGHHGWFWKNLTARPVVVTAIAKGTLASFAPVYAKGAALAASAPTAVASSIGATRYTTDLPLKTVMSAVFGHAAQEIWKRQGYVSDATGLHSLFPKNAEEWTLAENDALSLAGMTNILLLPGRRVDEQAWIDGVAGVRKSALALAALAHRQDKDAYMEAGVHLNDACSACHTRYAPGIP